MKLFRKKPEKAAVTLDANTDYRYVSPTDPCPFDVSELHNSCEELCNQAKVDERAADYRDPAIDAALNEHSAYLHGEYKLLLREQTVKIRNGAKAQGAAIIAEKAFLKEAKATLETAMATINNTFEKGDSTDEKDE